MSRFKHEFVEKNLGWLSIFMIIAVSIGGLVEITPLLFQNQTNEPIKGLKPYTALELEAS